MEFYLDIIKHNSIGYKETQCIYSRDWIETAFLIMVNSDDNKGEFRKNGCFLAEDVIKKVLDDFYISYRENYINKLWLRKKEDEIKKKIIELWREAVIKDFIKNKGEINDFNGNDIMKKYGVTFEAILFTEEIIVVTKLGCGDIVIFNKDDSYESLFKDLSYEDDKGENYLGNKGNYNAVKVKMIRVNETFKMPKAFITVSDSFIKSSPQKSEYEANIIKTMNIIENKGIRYGDHYIKRKVLQIAQSIGEDASMSVMLIDNIESILSYYRPVLKEENKGLEDKRLSKILELMIKDNEFFEKNRKMVENKWCLEGNSRSASIAASNIAYVLYKLGRGEEAKEHEKGAYICVADEEIYNNQNIDEEENMEIWRTYIK